MFCAKRQKLKKLLTFSRKYVIMYLSIGQGRLISTACAIILIFLKGCVFSMKNTKLKKAVNVLLNDKVVKTPKCNSSKSKDRLVHGVECTVTGEIHVYIPSDELNVAGVYLSVMQDVENQVVVLGDKIADFPTIQKAVKNKYSQERKFIFIVNDSEYVYCKSISVHDAIQYPFLWTQKAQNNGRTTKIGLCFRALKDVKKLLDDLEQQGIVEVVSKFEIKALKEYAMSLNPNKTNNGYLGESLISGNPLDFIESYARTTKKHDAYLKVTSKNGTVYKYAVEIKTSLTDDFTGLFEKKYKSPSSTNSIWTLEIKK